MTWNELADSIAQMTEEERQGKVKLESYNNGVILDCFLCRATVNVDDGTDGKINIGEWYLF